MNLIKVLRSAFSLEIITYARQKLYKLHLRRNISLNSAIAEKLSLKGYFNNVLNGEITRCCWLCALGHFYILIPCSLFTVGLAFIELFVNGLDKHKVS
jgi:hypothetical protein